MTKVREGEGENGQREEGEGEGESGWMEEGEGEGKGSQRRDAQAWERDGRQVEGEREEIGESASSAMARTRRLESLTMAPSLATHYIGGAVL